MQRGDLDHLVSTANLKCRAGKMGRGSRKVEKEGGESWEVGVRQDVEDKGKDKEKRERREREEGGRGKEKGKK